MAGNNNQDNQKPKRLDEFSDNFLGELSEQDRKVLKDWVTSEENKYKEQRQKQFQVENEKADEKKKKLDNEWSKKKKTFEEAEERYQKLLAKNKEKLDTVNAQLNSLDEQEKKEAKEKFDQKAPAIIRNYDEQLKRQERLLQEVKEFNQRLKDAIEIKKELESLEEKRRDVKYTDPNERSFETYDTLDLDKRKLTQSVVGLKFNQEEQKENKDAYQARMAELTNQFKQLEKEKNKFTTKVYDVFTGNKKKKKLTAELEKMQSEISRERRDFAEKQIFALGKESKLNEEFKSSQANLTNHSQKFTEDAKVNRKLLDQKKPLEEKLKKILDEEPNNKNKMSLKLGTSSELKTSISQNEDIIKNREKKLVQIKENKKNALDQAHKEILAECVLKNKEKHDDLNKQKCDLEHPLREIEVSIRVAKQAYEKAETDYNKHIQDINLTAISNRSKYGNEYIIKGQELAKKQTEIESRWKQYALLSQAIEELKHSEKKGSSSNSNKFQTMIHALESFSTIMRNPESKQSDMDKSCIDAIRACEDYVERRNQDYLGFMRSDYGKYRINRATSISSALKKFSPDVAAQFEQQKENTATRVRVSLTDNSNQKMVKTSPKEVQKAVEKTK